jgi:hypothetical protein
MSDGEYLLHKIIGSNFMEFTKHHNDSHVDFYTPNGSLELSHWKDGVVITKVKLDAYIYRKEFDIADPDSVEEIRYLVKRFLEA